MTADGAYWGQPGHEDDTPQIDMTLSALFDAFTGLRVAALFADDPSETGKVEEGLTVAEIAKFGFEPGTDEAKGLHLLINAVRRRFDGETS